MAWSTYYSTNHMTEFTLSYLNDSCTERNQLLNPKIISLLQLYPEHFPLHNTPIIVSSIFSYKHLIENASFLVYACSSNRKIYHYPGMFDDIGVTPRPKMSHLQ